MMELIVLGEIPGTQITITFQSVLATASLLLGICLARQIAKQHRGARSTNFEDITL